MEMCEEITQSNSKYERVERHYGLQIRDAKKVNAFESVSQIIPEGSFITARN